MSAYGVIYADPPWWYSQRCDTEFMRGGACRQYPLMRDVELAAMRPFIDSLADDNCALVMWTTGARLDFGVDLIRAWGFRYVTLLFVWVKTTKSGKPRTKPGHYTSQETELCLLGLRGSMPVAERILPQVYASPTTKHSEKPVEFRHRLECMWPDARRIELFCRHAPAGWDTWGNQVGILDGEHKVISPYRQDAQGRLFDG